MTHPTTAHIVAWPNWRPAAVAALRAMLAEIEGLAITGGESSVRFSPGSVEFGRWLAGFSPSGVSVKRLMTLPDRLGLPEPWAETFRSQCQRARQIYLSVEQTRAHVVAKVYWEHALAAVDQRHHAPAQRGVALHIESCKWRVDTPGTTPRSTEYWRMSGLDGPGTVALLQTAQDVDTALQPVYRSVAQVLDNAMRMAPDWHGHRLLLVREPGTARQGLGVRFYGSEWRIDDLAPHLSSLWESWDRTPQAWHQACAQVGPLELGWLHAGMDAQSQPYLTMYAALDAVQTRSVLRRQAFTDAATLTHLHESV